MEPSKKGKSSSTPLPGRISVFKEDLSAIAPKSKKSNVMDVIFSAINNIGLPKKGASFVAIKKWAIDQEDNRKPTNLIKRLKASILKALSEGLLRRSPKCRHCKGVQGSFIIPNAVSKSNVSNKNKNTDLNETDYQTQKKPQKLKKVVKKRTSIKPFAVAKTSKISDTSENKSQDSNSSRPSMIPKLTVPKFKNNGPILKAETFEAHPEPDAELTNESDSPPIVPLRSASDPNIFEFPDMKVNPREKKTFPMSGVEKAAVQLKASRSKKTLNLMLPETDDNVFIYWNRNTKEENTSDHKLQTCKEISKISVSDYEDLQIQRPKVDKISTESKNKNPPRSKQIKPHNNFSNKGTILNNQTFDLKGKIMIPSKDNSKVSVKILMSNTTISISNLHEHDGPREDKNEVFKKVTNLTTVKACSEKTSAVKQKAKGQVKPSRSKKLLPVCPSRSSESDEDIEYKNSNLSDTEVFSNKETKERSPLVSVSDSETYQFQKPKVLKRKTKILTRAHAPKGKMSKLPTPTAFDAKNDTKCNLGSSKTSKVKPSVVSKGPPRKPPRNRSVGLR